MSAAQQLARRPGYEQLIGLSFLPPLDEQDAREGWSLALPWDLRGQELMKVHYSVAAFA